MNLPKRKYPRFDFHDYNGGAYFVTVCTSEKRHYFGKIIDCDIKLSKIGKELQDNLDNISNHCNDVKIPLFQVMPNHFHAIVVINAPLQSVGSRPVATADKVSHTNSRLAVVIGGIKSHITRFARKNNLEFAWQSRFYDHIIRNNLDGNNIAQYITTNVQRWDSDCYNI